MLAGGAAGWVGLVAPSPIVLGVLVASTLVGGAALAVARFNPSLAICMVGVGLATASLMTTLSVARGFEREITRQLTRINGHMLLTKYGLDFFEYTEVAADVLRDARVVAASPFAYATVAIVREDRDVESQAPSDAPARPTVVIAKGIDPDVASQLSGLEGLFERGDLSGLRPGDTRHLPGIVLGRRVAERIGVRPGDRVRVVVPAEIDGAASPERPPRHASFEVLDRLHSGTAEIDGNLALMHLTAGQALFFQEGRVTGIEFELRDPQAVDEVVEALEGRLPAVFRFTTWKRTHGSFLVVLRQIRAALTLILGLMVVVAATSLVASLLLLVRRKRFDIGALAGMGADRSLVFWTFEVVGVVTGAVGAAGGLALGAIYTAVLGALRMPLQSEVYPLDHLPVAPSWWDGLGPAGFALLVCAVASGPVASMAAGVRPWVSLRG